MIITLLVNCRLAAVGRTWTQHAYSHAQHQNTLHYCLFQAFGGDFPPKTYNFPHTAAKLCALNLLFSPGMNYKYITKTFFQWTINTGKYSSLSNQKGVNLCLNAPKYVLRPGSAQTCWGSLCSSPDPLAAMGAYFQVRGTQGRREGTEREFPTSRVE